MERRGSRAAGRRSVLRLLARWHSMLSSRLPWLYGLLKPAVHWLAEREPLRWKFSRIYHTRGFGGKESVSGSGSSLEQTRGVRSRLPSLLAELGVRTLVDAPCGDYNWMREVSLEAEYIGVDIVRDLIDENQRRFGAPGRRFLVRDLTRDDLPRADLLLCRDCLVHLSLGHALAALRNFKRSGSGYLLITTFPKLRENSELRGRRWRPLNMELPPFNFPPALELIREGAGGEWSDKSLGLWRLRELCGS